MKSKHELEMMKDLIEGILSDKQIQKKNVSLNSPREWNDVDGKELDWEMVVQSPGLYRVKSTPRYRPFKDAEECWREMHKHKPFGWLKNKSTNRYSTLTLVGEEENIAINSNNGWKFSEIYRRYTFADGEPFGEKEN